MRRAFLLAALLGWSTAAYAAESSPAEAFIMRSDAAFRAIGAAAPGAPRIAACDRFAEAAFDLASLSRTVAGGTLWDGLAEGKRARFRAALHARLAADCARDDRPGTLALLATRQRRGDVSVTSRLLRADGSERILVWRLRAGGPWGWQATDVAADGMTLGTRLHDEVLAALDAAGGDVDAAIGALARGATRP
ncbi:ABC transporter substrate-binding protein [Roseomonas sp. HF4]|uniref:ABC transporter substrate-binding protein n=1 Tax=Roseomonas sp. HF4 TaxID=2562313 RepID=UPI001485AE78|nr:ABC transporter substrate-binding protein [Roseomonas sp. HF4]